MRPRHLALFIRSLFGHGGGGAERSMVNLATALAAQGHRVDLLLGRAEGPYLAAVPDDVRCIDLGARTPLTALPLLLRHPRLLRGLAPIHYGLSAQWSLGALPRLVRYLREERPEALLSALNYPNLTAILAREIAAVPTRLVVSERNTLSQTASRLTRRRRRALPELVSVYYPLADAIAAVSQGVAEDLARILDVPVETIAVTYSPVVSPELAKRAAEPVCHPWFTDAGPPVFLGAGKLHPQKDFPTLMRAFARVRAEREVRLVILGEGGERRALEALAKKLGLEKDVDLPGFVENPFAYMARASVFVLSSTFEGLPGVLIQAMACGCPVVSTDCPSGPSEILLGGEYGPLAPVSNPEALAEAMLTVLDSPVAADRLRERANFFSFERSSQRYLDVLLGAA